MKTRPTCLQVALLSAFLGLAVSTFARTWTSSDGKEIEAEYVSANETSVTIKRADGKSFTLPLSRLSKADQEWVAEKMSSSPTPPSASAAAGPISGPMAALVTSDWALSEHGDLPFALYASKDLDGSKKYPLLLALHGKSNNDENGRQVGGWIKSFARAENYEKRPCIIAAPLCYQPYGGTGGGWNDKPGDEAIELVEELIENLPIDENRIYVIGYSMGGFGTAHVMAKEPRLFTAGVPVAGYGQTSHANDLKRHPIWLFHAADDAVVGVDGARRFAEALERNKDFKYTEWPDGGHGIIGKVFNDLTVHEWLFAQGVE